MEGRQLLSLGAELPGTVNAETLYGQYAPANATNSSGETVVVWETQANVNGLDIHAQRYNSFGGKIGGELVVAGTIMAEYDPSVAIDDRGDFVVSWVEVELNGTGAVKARVFDPNGVGGNRIDVATANVAGYLDPDVAMDRYGDFVATYTVPVSGSNTDVYARRYNVSGGFLGQVGVATSAVAESHARVAMTPDGRFDVAYEQAYSASDHDVYMKRFAANGSLLGTNAISISTAYDNLPDVAVDNNGNGVVVWEQGKVIKAQRFTSAGATGALVTVSTTNPLVTSTSPSVALRRDNGGFVVSYQAFAPGVVNEVAEVSASNTVTTYNAGRGVGSVSVDAFGNYFMSYAATDGNDYNIHARRGTLLS